MEEVILTESTEETQDFAKKFSAKIKEGGIVLLYGNLGVGKTTFVQGLAKGLGINKRIISPTFIILRSYELSKIENPKSKITMLYHVDLYRMKNENEIEGIGLIELMKDPKNIIVIEWPEKLGSLMPEKVWKIYFETITENKRKLTINNQSN